MRAHSIFKAYPRTHTRASFGTRNSGLLSSSPPPPPLPPKTNSLSPLLQLTAVLARVEITSNGTTTHSLPFLAFVEMKLIAKRKRGFRKYGDNFHSSLFRSIDRSSKRWNESFVWNELLKFCRLSAWLRRKDDRRSLNKVATTFWTIIRLEIDFV